MTFPEEKPSFSTKTQRRRDGVSGGVATPVPEVKPVDSALVKARPNAAAPLRVPVANSYPARVVVRDTPSGETYIFAPGATLQVREQDVPKLRSMNQPGEKGCCGGGRNRIYFVFPA
jgi:hypothetical protein